MPDIDAFAKSYGLLVAILVLAALGLSRAVAFLYRENATLHQNLETLLSERNKSLEQLLENSYRDRSPRA
jgi:hypothetical protein